MDTLRKMSITRRFVFTITPCLFCIILLGCKKPALSQPPVDKHGYPATLTPEHMSQDIDFLLDTIKDSHPNPYAYIDRKDFKKALQKVQQICSQGNMSIDKFYFQTAWLVGQLKNGHTSMQQPQGWQERVGKKVFPVYFWLDNDKVFLQTGRFEKRYNRDASGNHSGKACV